MGTHNRRLLLSAFADESSEVFAKQLDAVKRNGIDHIEIRSVDGAAVHTLPLDKIRSIKQQADDAGIGFSALGSALGKCEIDGDMDQQCEICRHLIEVAYILNTPYIRMFSFKMPKNQPPEVFRQQVIDSLGLFVDIVADSGISLAHENENHIYGETAERCLDLYTTFSGSGVFRGVFDFANFVQAGQDPLEDCWPQLKKYIAYFHIKDAVKEDRRVVPAGQGAGKIREILREAYSDGFDSFLTLEPHLWPRFFSGNSAERFDLAANALHSLYQEL